MAYENLLIEKADRHAILTINRPNQLNALNKKTIDELHQALGELEADAAVRVIVLTGAGEKSFVAGADIKEFANFNVEEGTRLAAEGQSKLFDRLENLSKPVIAAVNGFALGGGLELAMACHIRIASSTARMGLPETSLGLIPGYGGTQRLAQLVGKGRAHEMIMTAQMISAQRAYEMGLVNAVAEPDQLLSTAVELVGKITKNAPMAIHSAIRAVNAAYNEAVNGYTVEIEEFGKCFGTENFVEGTTAFLEKRKPNFD